MTVDFEKSRTDLGADMKNERVQVQTENILHEREGASFTYIERARIFNWRCTGYQESLTSIR